MRVHVGRSVWVARGCDVGLASFDFLVGVDENKEEIHEVGMACTVETALRVTSAIGVGGDVPPPVTGKTMVLIGVGIQPAIISFARATAVLFILA